MAKAAIPLRALSVGGHYNLSLRLGNGASLNCTVVMPSAPARAEALEQSREPRGSSGVMGISGGGDNGAGYEVGHRGLVPRVVGVVREVGGRRQGQGLHFRERRERGQRRAGAVEHQRGEDHGRRADASREQPVGPPAAVRSPRRVLLLVQRHIPRRTIVLELPTAAV